MLHHLRPLATIALVLCTLPCARGEENPQLESLDQRVQTLEKSVLKDPFHPDDTVLSRLKDLEDRFDAAEKAGGRSAKTESRQDDQVKNALDALGRQVRDLDQRLRTAEQNARRPETASDANELRELRNSLSQLSRTLNDLQDRVRRLEAKR